MTRPEVAQLLMLIRAAYHTKDRIQPNESELMVSIWHEMLQDQDNSVVLMATKIIIAESKYPPSVAEILDKIRFIKSSGVQELTGQQAWTMVRKALKNGLYHAKEEYDKLPREIQLAIGDYASLRTWAEMDQGELETVVQSHFIKSYNVKSSEKQAYERLPADIKKMIENTTKLIGGK